MCNAFAAFSNLCKARPPGVVIQDIKRFLFNSNASRMDGSKTPGGNGLGTYTISAAGKSYTFTQAELALAPPSGAFAGNYARAIRREYQPHEYSISWTTTRDLSLTAPKP
ncbi:hypothetical protein BDN72DRAFT_863896 [Pluteus cervinus]|uniref:Uncharacterized protein n=1 Tax=Pluteus cervinus TaxID=181527 RepID=A0ACD3A5V2_9AGAR|nr:hypothetical protein BDN72DRAFT_863896 [Pluteus cervinus]